MKTIRFGLTGGLGERELEEIRSGVLAVLRDVGVQCEHRRTLELLSTVRDISVAGDRVRFAPQAVELAIERARRTAPRRTADADVVSVRGPWNCYNIEDLQDGSVRPSTAADVREMFKLVEVTKAGVICPVYPTDVDSRLQLLYLEKAGIELTETDGSRMEFSDPQMLELAVAMYRAAGRTYHMLVQFPISPLRLNPLALETIWRYMGRDDIVLFPAAAPIPQAGLTAPMFVPGALVQAVAETFAGYIVMDAIGGGKLTCYPQYRVDLFDMRYLTTVYASPEHIQYQLVLNDVCRYFSGQPVVSHYFCSNAVRSDHQAMLERTSWMLILALAGVRRFSLGAGQLCMDEVFSPAQFVIDQEIARYVTHFIHGLEYVDEPGASEAVIAEVGPGGNYLTHPTTLERVGSFFDSELFPRMNVNQWREAGEPDAWRKAAARARELVGSHRRTPPQGLVDELDRIYREAERYAASR